MYRDGEGFFFFKILSFTALTTSVEQNFLENLIGAQLLKNFPSLYEAQKFVTFFTKAHLRSVFEICESSYYRHCT
jgi:hypothetical protein